MRREPARPRRAEPYVAAVLRRALLAVCLLCFAFPGAAAAQTFGGFHSVLGFGEGESTSPQDLAAFEANNTVPPSDVNQRQQYEGLEQAWPGFTAADLDKYYKNS